MRALRFPGKTTLILAAALFFAPHYETTLPYNANVPVSDAKGNLYFISDVVSPTSQSYWVTRVDPDGNVVYRVIPAVVAGSYCQSNRVTPDAEGNLYVASSCLPSGGNPQIVISKLGPSGTILYTLPTQISASSNVNGMAVGPDGSVFLAGSASPRDLATTDGAYVSSAKAPPGELNAFAVEVNAAGTAIKYATFLNNAPQSTLRPQSPSTAGVAIAVDSLGDAYITGTTEDAGFPTSDFAFNRNCNCSIGNPGVFVVKLNGDGSNIVYSTFLIRTPRPLLESQSISVTSGLQAVVTEVFNGNESLISTTRLDQYGVQLLNYDEVTFEAQDNLVAPDGRGNLLVSGQNAPTNLPISAGEFSKGTNFVALVRIADGSILYATRLPTGSAISEVLPDGSGGFLVVGSVIGVLPYPSTPLTRIVPASSPTPTVLGVANAAGLEVSPGLAPGEITSIYGAGLGPSPGLHGKFDASGRLPDFLGGTEVYFNGMRAPLLYAGDQQVNAIVPFGVSGQTVRVVLIVNGKVSNQAYLPKLAAAPEIFKASDALAPLTAFAVNEDGSINSAQHPAKGGSVLTLFVSGAGLLSPTPKDGTRGGRGPQLVLPVAVYVSITGGPGKASGEVLYAGSAPTLAAGILQINVRLPVEDYVGPSQVCTIYFADPSNSFTIATAFGVVWIAGK